MVKTVVIDNSALIPLFLADESPDYSRSIIKLAAEGVQLLSPSFWLAEFGNTLATCVRRQRITPAEAAHAYHKLAELPVAVVEYLDWKKLPAIHDVAVRCELSFYDALYLTLAMDEGARLATLDKALIRAAEREGVEIVS